MTHSAAAMAAMTALSAMLLLAGCYTDNKNYNADARSCESGGSDSCPSAMPFCVEEVCVQCTTTDASLCTGNTPICGVNGSCQACSSHAQCLDSKVCLPTGGCALAADVAYVAPNGVGAAPCDQAAPCGTLALALTTSKSIIKMATGLVKDNKITVIDGRDVVILADPGAVLDRDMDGPILQINGKSGGTNKVMIRDLELRGASADNAINISVNGGQPDVTLVGVDINNNQGLAVFAPGGKLTVYRSKIHDNSFGGISVMGNFSIINNFFYNNGADNRNVGGIGISATDQPDNRLEFNSFYKNKASTGIGTGIQCIGTFNARNNLLYDNDTATNTSQVGGNCTHSYSLISPVPSPPVGAGVFDADPQFASTTSADLSVLGTSPAIGKADPGTALENESAFDIDGEKRVAPADVGADELPKQR